MNIAGLFQTWLKVLTRPGEEVFAEERQQENATFVTAFVGIGIAALISAIFKGLALWLSLFVFQPSAAEVTAGFPPEMAEIYIQLMAQLTDAAPAITGLVFCGTLILTPIGFFIGSLIWFGLAKLFGGSSDFEEQTYLLATFTAPIIIVSSIVGIVPYLSLCITFLLFIYRLVLTYFALKVAHNLTSGRASGVIASWLALLFFLACCILALLVAPFVFTMPGTLPNG